MYRYFCIFPFGICLVAIPLVVKIFNGFGYCFVCEIIGNNAGMLADNATFLPYASITLVAARYVATCCQYWRNQYILAHIALQVLWYSHCQLDGTVDVLSIVILCNIIMMTILALFHHYGRIKPPQYVQRFIDINECAMTASWCPQGA